MIERHDPDVCGVCACSAVGLGYAPQHRAKAPIMWICNDAECIEIARNSYDMRQDDFTRIESLAAQEGRRAAEAFCDEVGKYDFRNLTEEEACEFARRLVGGYRHALKVKLRDEAPF